jgi:hypothetical protein
MLWNLHTHIRDMFYIHMDLAALHMLHPYPSNAHGWFFYWTASLFFPVRECLHTNHIYRPDNHFITDLLPFHYRSTDISSSTTFSWQIYYHFITWALRAICWAASWLASIHVSASNASWGRWNLAFWERRISTTVLWLDYYRCGEANQAKGEHKQHAKMSIMRFVRWPMNMWLLKGGCKSSAPSGDQVKRKKKKRKTRKV